MEVLEIIYTGIYGVALTWCCLTLFKLSSRQAVHDEIMKTIIADQKTLAENQDKLANRLDLFLNKEIDTLKELVKGRIHKE